MDQERNQFVVKTNIREKSSAVFIPDIIENRPPKSWLIIDSASRSEDALFQSLIVNPSH